MTKPHSPNDDRSNVKNPNNPQHEKDRQNRIELGHEIAPPAPPPSRDPGVSVPVKPMGVSRFRAVY